MKILFLTASAGEGHNAICRTLNSYVTANYPHVETKTVDIFKGSSKLRHSILNNYYHICNMFPRLSNQTFQHTRKVDYTNKPNALVAFFVQHAVKLIKKLLEEEKFDVIYCAHTFAAIAVTKIREKHPNLIPKEVKVFSVVSDFDVAPLTERLKLIDYIFVPSKDLVDDVKAKNLSDDKIIVASIPISETFYQSEDKALLREKLNLKDKFTVLMMSGAKSFTNTYLILKDIIKNKTEQDDFQIIVINGKNQKLYNQINKLIEKTGADFIYNYGFVDRIEPYMEASDVVFSKLGGITTTEALAKELPIIAPSRLPLQENNNRDFLAEKNICLPLKKDKDLINTIRYIRIDENHQKMKDAIKEFNQTNDLHKICEKMVNGNEINETA